MQAVTPRVSSAPSDYWVSFLASLLPGALHVPAKEQECAPCRPPGSSEMNTSDDKTYLKMLNLCKIKAMTTAEVAYKTE